MCTTTTWICYLFLVPIIKVILLVTQFVIQLQPLVLIGHFLGLFVFYREAAMFLLLTLVSSISPFWRFCSRHAAPIPGHKYNLLRRSAEKDFSLPYPGTAMLSPALHQTTVLQREPLYLTAPMGTRAWFVPGSSEKTKHLQFLGNSALVTADLPHLPSHPQTKGVGPFTSAVL